MSREIPEPKKLWPEMWGTPGTPLTSRGPSPPHLVGAKARDAVANQLHKEVCGMVPSGPPGVCCRGDQVIQWSIPSTAAAARKFTSAARPEPTGPSALVVLSENRGCRFATSHQHNCHTERTDEPPKLSYGHRDASIRA